MPARTELPRHRIKPSTVKTVLALIACACICVGNAAAQAAASAPAQAAPVTPLTQALINLVWWSFSTKEIDAAAVRSLLAQGADPNARLSNGYPLLQGLAEWTVTAKADLVKNGSKSAFNDVVYALIEKGADVNAALESIAWWGGADPGIARALIAHTADLNSPLRIATDTRGGKGRDPDLAILLIDAGADVNTKDAQGLPVLFNVVSQGNKDVVQHMIAKGVDVNAIDSNGETPLWYALSNYRYLKDTDKDVMASQQAMISLLVSAGARVDGHDRKGETLFEWANQAIKPPDIDEAMQKLRPAENRFVQTVANLPLPQTAQEPFQEGMQAAQRQQWNLAIRYFEQARQAAPFYPTPLFNLGLAEAHVPGRELRAICWFNAYLDIAPKVPNADAVRSQIIELKVRAQANLARLIDLLKDSAAKQVFGPPFQFATDPQKDVAVALLLSGDPDAASALIGSIPYAEQSQVVAQTISDASGGFSSWYPRPSLIQGMQTLARAVPYQTNDPWRWDPAYDIAFNQMEDRDFSGAEQTIATITDSNKSSDLKQRLTYFKSQAASFPSDPGPLEQSDIWTEYVEKNLKELLFTDFESVLQNLPSTQPTESMPQAAAIFLAIHNQADNLAWRLIDIHSMTDCLAQVSHGGRQ